MTTTLIACDKFKGSLTAAEVCAAVEAGIRSASPETEVISIPIADGGDGTAAAAVMGRLSASVRALARLDLEPQEILAQLEEALEDLAEPMLATLLYIVVDPATGHCRITRAGHPPPALVTPDGEVQLLQVPPGTPLGVGGTRYITTDRTLEPGSVLVLYTDGLIESRTSDIDERLAELTNTLAEPSPSLDAMCDSLLARLVPASADDDIALLIARTAHAKA